MIETLRAHLDEAGPRRLEAFTHARGWIRSQAIRAAVRALARAG